MLRPPPDPPETAGVVKIPSPVAPADDQEHPNPSFLNYGGHHDVLHDAFPAQSAESPSRAARHRHPESRQRPGGQTPAPQTVNLTTAPSKVRQNLRRI